MYYSHIAVRKIVVAPRFANSDPLCFISVKPLSLETVTMSGPSVTYRQPWTRDLLMRLTLSFFVPGLKSLSLSAGIFCLQMAALATDEKC